MIIAQTIFIAVLLDPSGAPTARSEAVVPQQTTLQSATVMESSSDGRPTDTRQRRYPKSTNHAKTAKMEASNQEGTPPATGEWPNALDWRTTKMKRSEMERLMQWTRF
ncbi:MAG: hypothetical protein AMXMBFR26_10890 [Porticoccaceae bacterium]